MTPLTRYRLGNALLAVAILALVFELLEMTERIPRYIKPIVLSTSILVVVAAAGSMRRSARAQMALRPPHT
jgi:hypothetical protein